MTLFERTPRVRIRPGDPWDVRAARLAVRLVWGWRLELCALAAVWATHRALVLATDARWGRIILFAFAAALLAEPSMAATADGWLRLAALRRRWDRACRHAKLTTGNDRVPRILTATAVPAGQRVTVAVPAGSSVPELEAKAETVAAHLRLREVRVTRDPADAQRATVTLVRVDPLAGTVAVPWPLLDAPRLSLWDAFLVAVDEDGEAVSVALPERNLLLGGEPGAGKSVAQSLPLAVAALDLDVDLYLQDGKRVELGWWRPCATSFVGPDLDAAIRVLRELQAEMDRRYDWLDTNQRRKVTRGDGVRLAVVVIDELAFFLTMGDRTQTKDYANLLRDLVSRGRAAGIIVIAATQKPSGDVVPTALRDLFGFRWAFRCSTRDASDTILGAGWATLGYSAATVEPQQRGVGYLLAEGGTPIRVRSFHLADHDLAAIASRAAELRGAHPAADRSEDH